MNAEKIFNLQTTDRFDPYFIGMDRIRKHMEDINNFWLSSPGESNKYPPYNIIKVDDEKYLLEMAVAGLTKDDLEIEVKDNLLTIKGSKQSETEETHHTNYIHRGVAKRAFTQSFKLGENIEVSNAELQDGMLKIEFIHLIPEEKKPKKIEISGESPQQLLTE